MKHLIILGDGMADHAIDRLNRLTPLQAAHKPNIDLLAREGRTGRLITIPDGFSPGGADLQGVRIGETRAEYEWLDGAMTALKVYTGPLRDGEECEIVLTVGI